MFAEIIQCVKVFFWFAYFQRSCVFHNSMKPRMAVEETLSFLKPITAVFTLLETITAIYTSGFVPIL